MTEITYKIWSGLWHGDLDKIKKLMDDYEPLSDCNFNHPILHEISHQAGNNSDYIEDENNNLEQKKLFKRQNEVFKFLFKHEKFKTLLDDRRYEDKYNYTALERLRVEYDTYCDEMKEWVKSNILPECDKIEIHVDRLYGVVSFKNRNLFCNYIK